MRNRFLFLAVFFLAITLSPKAFSYSLNAATGLALEKSFIVSTLDTADLKNKAYAGGIALTYGISPNLEVNAVNNFSLSDGEKKYDAFTFQPRYDFGSNQIFALSVTYDKSGTESFILSPQYHTLYEPENSVFCFVFNLGTNFYFKENQENNNAFAFFSPVYKIVPNQFHVFFELAPAYQFQGESKGISLNLSPGFWIGFQEAKYQIILALLINNVVNPLPESEVEWGAGFYFAVTF